MSSEGFIKLKRGEAVEKLLTEYPNDFRILTLIALRARWSNLNTGGLKMGEAFIGDYKSCGLTRGQYRHAISRLKSRQIITTRATNRGTIARLASSRFYDINMVEATSTATTQQPSSDHQTTTNKERKNKEKEKVKKESPVVFPDWLNIPLWKEYKKMRVKIKKPLTDYSEKRAINSLARAMKKFNQSQEELLNRSIDNSWRGFFQGRKGQESRPLPTNKCKACGLKSSSLIDGRCKRCDGLG